MNTNNIHSPESLASMPRKALIETAIEAGITKPHTTKSAVLIEAITAAQAAAETLEAPAPAVDEDTLEVVEPVIEIQAEAITTDNVVPFDAAPPEQQELPTEEEPSISHGIFKVNRKAFHRQILATARVVAGSHTMPVLGCVLLVFGDGKLAVHANDLANYLVTETQAETTGSFSLAVPQSVLAKFVGKCSSEFLMAEIVGTKLVISDLENRTEIMGIPETEWAPSVPVTGQTVMEIGAKELVRLVSETIKAASSDESRYILNGLAIDTTAGVIVTTDGRRLVKAPIGVECLTQTENPLILPIHAAHILTASIPQDTPVTVTFSGSGNRIRFSTEATGLRFTLDAKLVDGRFPNYHQVIPAFEDGYGVEFELNTAEMVDALGRLLVVAEASQKSPTVKMEFSATGLLMNAANVSVGSGKEQIGARGGIEGETQMTAMNGNYVLEILASWGDEKITVHVKDEMSPMLIRAGGKVAVIMPVRLS